METVVLSARNTQTGPAWGCVIEFEDVLAELTGAAILPVSSICGPRFVPNRFRRTRYAVPRPAGDRGAPRSERVLFLVTINGRDLQMLEALGNWREQFGTVCAYVFDAFEPEWSDEVRRLDHVFVPMTRAVEELAPRFGVPFSFLPMACDVVRFGSPRVQRPIDVMGYGRQRPDHSQALERAWNDTDGARIYYHTTFRGPHVTNHREHRRLFWKLLQRARIALAYDVTTTGGDRFPYSFVAQRWFEEMAAGCAVVGKRPRCAEADSLLSWPDATIEIPDDPREAVEFLEALLGDEPRLAAIHQRNYQEALARHDWRQRVAVMLQTLNLPIAVPGEQARGLLHRPVVDDRLLASDGGLGVRVRR